MQTAWREEGVLQERVRELIIQLGEGDKDEDNESENEIVCVCVCSNANPLHYYAQGR